MLEYLNKRLPRSIRSRLILASLACILLPAALTLSIYNSLTEKAVRQQAATNAENALELVNGSVTQRMGGMLNIVNYIQVNSGLNTYFKLVASGNEGGDPYSRFTEANRVLEQLDSLTVLGERSYVTVLLTNGAYYMNYSVSDYNPLDWMDRPWFEKLNSLRGLESYWTGPEPTTFNYDKFGHPYQISVARPLRRGDSEIYGYVIVTVMEDQINQIFRKLSAGQEVLLTDAGGTIVSHRNPERVGASFTYASPEGDARSSLIRKGKETYLLTERNIPMAGWRLVMMQPYKEAIVNISSIFNKVFLFQMVSFAVFLLILICLVRAFTQPLVRLSKVTTAVQRGNLEVRTGVRGNDEIGRLGLLFDQMLDRVKEMIAEISASQARKRNAELKMLQAQINPHFLFNVLNSIRMKIMKHGDLESAKMVGSLSVLLRMTISREEDEITLHEEIDLVSHYVSLMNLRQREAALLDLQIDPEAFLVRVPRFILQPVVENALIHGLRQRAGLITIRAVMRAGEVILSVYDNGGGMPPERLADIRTKLADGTLPAEGQGRGGHFSGIGLHNVAERMAMIHGEAFRMQISSEPGSGTVIEMHFPQREGARDVQRDAGG